MQYRIGVLGATGYIGTPYRKEMREAGDRAKIVGLCARRRDRLELAAREDNATLITDDWREIVEHPETNLLLVLTPDALHCEPVLAAADDKTILRPDIAGLIHAAYDPVLPATAGDPSHALRLAARVGQVQ